MADMATASTPKTDNSLSGIIGQTGKLVGEEQKFASDAQQQLGDIQKSQEALGDDFHEQLKNLKAQAPEIPQYKPFQAPQQESPAKAFGSFAGLLATVASFESKTPLTTSLNAMAAGMRAIREGNAEAYDKAFKEWQINTDYAFKIADMENQRYNQNIDLAKTDYTTAMANLQSQATMLQDEAAMFSLRSGGIASLGNLIATREQLGIEAMKARGILERQGQAQQKKMQTVNSLTDGIKQIDQAVQKLQENQKAGISVTGIGGMVNRTVESIKGQGAEYLGLPAPDQPARDFDTQMDNIKNVVTRNLILKSKYMSPHAQEVFNDLVKGEGHWDTPHDALNSLMQMRGLLQSEVSEVSNTPVGMMEFDSADSVKAAYSAGEIGPDEAQDILRKKFGYQ